MLFRSQIILFYLAPELFGAPKEKRIIWARRGKAMQHAKELQQKKLSAEGSALHGALPSATPAAGEAEGSSK